jgi:hypothetical protein
MEVRAFFLKSCLQPLGIVFTVLTDNRYSFVILPINKTVFVLRSRIKRMNG